MSIVHEFIDFLVEIIQSNKRKMLTHIEIQMNITVSQPKK